MKFNHGGIKNEGHEDRRNPADEGITGTGNENKRGIKINESLYIVLLIGCIVLTAFFTSSETLPLRTPL